MSTIRLSTLVEVDLSGDSTLDEAVSALRVAFNEVSREYPAMRKFLVRPFEDQAAIRVGVLLEDVNPKYAEDMATELLDRVIEVAERTENHHGDHADFSKHESVSLAFA